MMTRCEDLVRRFHAVKGRPELTDCAESIWPLCQWLLAPYTLWPIDVQSVADQMLSTVESGGKIDPSAHLLLKMLGLPPCEKTRDEVATYERMIEAGSYESLLRQPEKFSEMEQAVTSDPEFAAAWAEIKRQFTVKRFQNSKGIIRRRMTRERNFRGDWQIDWRKKEQRFHAVFDAFCFRWDLYGMEWDAPLPLKLTVNLTPHGTMILIPRHWSPDFARDLDWRKIGKLHRAHGARRQGPVLSVGRIERQSEAEQAQVFVQEGRRAGLKGEKLTDFVLGKLGRDLRNGSDFLKRLLRKKPKGS